MKKVSKKFIFLVPPSTRYKEHQTRFQEQIRITVCENVKFIASESCELKVLYSSLFSVKECKEQQVEELVVQLRANPTLSFCSCSLWPLFWWVLLLFSVFLIICGFIHLWHSLTSFICGTTTPWVTCLFKSSASRQVFPFPFCPSS